MICSVVVVLCTFNPLHSFVIMNKLQQFCCFWLSLSVCAVWSATITSAHHQSQRHCFSTLSSWQVSFSKLKLFSPWPREQLSFLKLTEICVTVNGEKWVWELSLVITALPVNSCWWHYFIHLNNDTNIKVINHWSAFTRIPTWCLTKKENSMKHTHSVDKCL